MPKGKYWTEAEQDHLETWAGRKTIPLIAEELGRTTRAVRSRLSREGVTAVGMQGQMTTGEVAAEYGTTYAHVKTLIRRKLLKATRRRGSFDHMIWPEDAEKVSDLLRDTDSLVRGEYNGRTKLTAENVREILSSELSNPELARRYGVARATIHQVRAGRTWKHLAPRKWYERDRTSGA